MSAIRKSSQKKHKPKTCLINLMKESNDSSCKKMSSEVHDLYLIQTHQKTARGSNLKSPFSMTSKTLDSSVQKPFMNFNSQNSKNIMASDNYKNRESFQSHLYDMRSQAINIFNKDLNSTPSPYTEVKKQYATARSKERDEINQSLKMFISIESQVNNEVDVIGEENYRSCSDESQRTEKEDFSQNWTE